MASSMLPKSLQRTDSTGQLNVFLLLKKKSNDDLLIVSREDLPPTLRSGKLVLNQKIILRDEERNSIEGVIIYMHADRENCLAFKNQMLGGKMQHTNESIAETSSSFNRNSSASSPHTIINAKLPKNVSKSTSASALLPKRKPTKSSSSNNPSVEARPKPSSSKKQSVETRPQALHEIEDQQDDDDDISNYTSSLCMSPLSSTTNLSEKNKTQPTSNSTFDSAIILSDDIGNDVFIDKINQLSLEVAKLKQMVKDRDAELKRLRSTTIDLPTDQASRDYILYQAEKVRQSTTEFKYIGNLTKDANSLGIHVVKLNEVLNWKTGITSIAREIFKTIIPEHKRSVSNWNQLPEEVILKEKLLIDFLTRYFGPLAVDPKKLHTSIVGCLRNGRGKQNKQVNIPPNNDNDSDRLENINGDDDDEHY